MPDTQTTTTPTNTSQGTVNKSSRTRRVLIRLGVTVAILAALLSGGYYYFFNNYAKDAAQPLETALVKAGGVKMCSNGDTGRGPDNFAPGYVVVIELNANKDEAVKLINKVADENGYKLTYQQSPYKSLLWYSDDTSKKSGYPGFDHGNIKVSFNIYSDDHEANVGCSVRSDAAHTGILLNVGLPDARNK